MSQGSGGGNFAISDSQIEFAGILAFASTVPGTIVCGLVLIAYAIAALSPTARRCFDRVSFWLLLYSLVFNVLFGIAYAATPMSPGTACNVGAFAVNFTLSFATFFTTCIAINLHHVLIQGVNGNKMEKYYVIITVLLTLALNIPTFALGQFGWNDLSATCWYSNPDNTIRLRWIVATQSFWISLAATIETICSTLVLFWLFRFQRSIDFYAKAAALLSDPEKIATRYVRTAFVHLEPSRSSMLSQDPRYRKIILRIDFRLLVLGLLLYGIRLLAYGLLAAGDPSFINAMQHIRNIKSTNADGRNRTITSINFTHPTVQFSSDASQGDSSKVESQVQEKSRADTTLVKMTPEDQESSRQADVEQARHQTEDDIRDLERQL